MLPGLDPTTAQLWNQNGSTINGNKVWPDISDTAEPGDLFGSALTAGDFNGDGRCDLAIGVLWEDVGSIQDVGAVNVLYGLLGTGLTDVGSQFWHQNSPGIPDACETGDGFGGG
jgi:hypothetical protein